MRENLWPIIKSKDLNPPAPDIEMFGCLSEDSYRDGSLVCDISDMIAKEPRRMMVGKAQR